LKLRTLRKSTGTANQRMNGRNLPNLVIVRSTMRPAERSVNGSQNRTTRNIVPTAAAATSVR